MDENFECDLYKNEEYTIKNCSNLEIKKIIKKDLGKGTYGIVYPVIVQFGTKEVTLVLKKISNTLTTKTKQNEFIDEMYDEVEYSYDMGKNRIGPHVYDAFFYQDGNTINQYILMEKFDTSVSNWILSQSNLLNSKNCQFVGDEMLNILHKQIFVLNTYCGDIKTDNFVINFNPMIVRMIDFGIDWCSNTKLPNEYSKVKSIKEYSLDIKKEIFYCLCTLQLFMNVININTPLNIAKMILKPFYKDNLFIKYVLKKPLQNILLFAKTKNSDIDFKQILFDILEYNKDQAILIKHYIRPNNDKQLTNQEIIDYVYNTIKKMTIMIFK